LSLCDIDAISKVARALAESAVLHHGRSAGSPQRLSGWVVACVTPLESAAEPVTDPTAIPATSHRLPRQDRHPMGQPYR
jgi:hypothetical protein